ncbi:short chain dehydrogenase/reductase family protein [Auricularia subglabra TFB-10046 SS5]|nr:short chain dehydrogenase/reductase family protein [Auricularia subglabra TFB-10046 SS5]
MDSTQRVQSTINSWTGGEAFQQRDVQGLQGRTALVTGGTRGIGYEVAKTLALAGARVILVSRKPENGQAALSSIEETARAIRSHSGHVDTRFVKCDLGQLSNVKDVADMLAKEEPRLDILVNNGGVGVAAFGLNNDGIERIFGVNILGHFVFTNRLLPLLRKTAQRNAVHPGPTPRIISLTSNLHQLAPSSTKFESLEELNDPNLRADQYYARSKLGVILCTKALAQIAIAPYPEGILALSVHPGAVSTDIQQQVKEAFGTVLGSAMLALQTPMLRAPDEGSLGVLWAATVDVDAENIKELQGAYVTDPGKIGGETDAARDAALAERLWKLCETLAREKLGKDAALLPWGKDSRLLDHPDPHN